MHLTPVMQKYILHWGEMGARWGINRTVAQIHALLFLADKPLFADVAEVHRAYSTGEVSIHAKVKVRIDETIISEHGEERHETNLVETTVGRALLAEIRPSGMPWKRSCIHAYGPRCSPALNRLKRRMSYW